jgi:two-component system, NarL family, nitrate/nitrite response regulator NarL
MEPLRILLADDHALFRGGIAALLSNEPKVLVVGEARDGEEAIALARSTAPDVILMDIAMPKIGGLEAIRRIKLEMPRVQIIALTISDSDADLITAFKNGAQGYLLKSMEPAQLFETINAARRGQVLLPLTTLDRIRQEYREPERKETTKPREAMDGLTPRESEVLGLVADGLTNKEIAAALCITESTVKTFLHNTLEKLHLRNRIQLAIYAVHRGMGGKTTDAA